MWTLGEPGETVDTSWTWDRDPDREAGPVWAQGTRALDRDGSGARRIIEQLGARDDGMLWAIVSTRMGRRPARFDGGAWTIFPPPPGPGVIQLDDGIIDADGNLWFDRDNEGGLGIYDGRSVRTIGVGHRIVPGPFDDEGRMWARLVERSESSGPSGIVVIDADLVEEARSGEHIEDAELAARFPARLAGRDLEIVTLTGEQWLRQFQLRPRQQPPPRPELDAFLKAAEASIEDLTMGYTSFEPSPGNRAFLAAVRVQGADATDLVDAVIPVMLGNLEEPASEPAEIAGRHVQRITDAAVPGAYPQYAYAAGDTVWVIDAEGSVLSEILEALP